MCFPENLAVSISAIATVIAQGRTEDEIELMAAVFTQIGDTLATIAVARGICESAREREEESAKTE